MYVVAIGTITPPLQNNFKDLGRIDQDIFSEITESKFLRYV